MKLVKNSMVLIFVLMPFLFLACDFQPVEPEIAKTTTLEKTASTSMPFPYLQEFVQIKQPDMNWWVSNDTVYVKFISGNVPHAKNYFLFVEHENYNMFYYIHAVQSFFAVPYAGNGDVVKNIALYGIALD